MLEVKKLNKSFGGIHVTRDVSFSVKAGERRVILGPNGAGKTTLFNLLVGTLAPTAGDILLEGKSISALSVSQRAQSGIARSYQKNNLFNTLTVRENLALAAAAGLGLGADFRKDSFRDPKVMDIVADCAGQTGLAALLDHPVNVVSYGNRRQLEIGLALATRPRLLLMDEPTSGIGPNMIAGFTRLLRNLPKSLTLLVIEHDLKLAFDIADHVTVLNFGEVVFDGPPAKAKSSKLVRDIYLGNWKGHA